MKIIDWYHSFESFMFRIFDNIADTVVGRWLGEGTKWGWLLLGFILGLMSDSFYCSSLVGGTAIICGEYWQGVEIEGQCVAVCADYCACARWLWARGAADGELSSKQNFEGR